MARQVEGAWYRKAKDTWYATVDGRKVSLGVRGKESRKEAQQAWHRVMANPPAPKPVVAAKEEPMPAALTVRHVVDAFLIDAEMRLKKNTVRIYRGDLEAFCRCSGKIAADELTPQQIARWLHSLPVSDTTKAMTLRSVAACLSWAEKNDLMKQNPARKVSKPKSRSRSEEAIISEEEHGKLMGAASPEFRLVLRILWATGCRPDEVGKITVENLNLETGIARLTEHKTDYTGKPRLIFLPPDIAAELKKLIERFKRGALLRSRQGNAWTGRSITKQVRYYCELVGVKAIAYGYRHTFATDALANGVPDAQVAALLGHTSTAMLHRHYSHLTSRADVLRAAAAMVR